MKTTNYTQEQRLAMYLYNHGKATAREIFECEWMNAPWKIASNLRKQGFVDTERVTITNSEGINRSIAVYSLSDAGRTYAFNLIYL